MQLHEQIFQLSYFSNGAINVTIAYSLPVYLRNYYYNLLVKLKEQENKSYERSSTPPKKGKVDKPF